MSVDPPAWVPDSEMSCCSACDRRLPSSGASTIAETVEGTCIVTVVRALSRFCRAACSCCSFVQCSDWFSLFIGRKYTSATSCDISTSELGHCEIIDNFPPPFPSENERFFLSTWDSTVSRCSLWGGGVESFFRSFQLRLKESKTWWAIDWLIDWLMERIQLHWLSTIPSPSTSPVSVLRHSWPTFSLFFTIPIFPLDKDVASLRSGLMRCNECNFSDDWVRFSKW